MLKTTKADGLQIEIKKILDEFSGATFESLVESAEIATKRAHDLLKQTSPQRTGKYAKSWKVKKEKGARSYVATIYNSEKPHITHLLENGHASRNGGRVKAYPHIAKANEEAERIFYEELKRRI